MQRLYNLYNLVQIYKLVALCILVQRMIYNMRCFTYKARNSFKCDSTSTVKSTSAGLLYAKETCLILSNFYFVRANLNVNICITFSMKTTENTSLAIHLLIINEMGGGWIVIFCLQQQVGNFKINCWPYSKEVK